MDKTSWKPKVFKATENVDYKEESKENWKDVADKFYQEQLNKSKKSAEEGQHGCPFCGGSFGGSFFDHVRKNHTEEEFTQLQNDGWVPERSVYGKANETYFVEWGYDLDYDFEETDNIDEAKQLAKDNGGNVYLDDELVYSVIPSIKSDPTNDKSSFIMANNLMGVEKVRTPEEQQYYEDNIWDDMTHSKGYDDDETNESLTSEGFNQGLYGYVDAKCKTCGVEFDSIPDMDDHYAMNSDHISNLDDLDNDIPNSD